MKVLVHHAPELPWRPRGCPRLCGPKLVPALSVPGFPLMLTCGELWDRLQGPALSGLTLSGPTLMGRKDGWRKPRLGLPHP